MEPIYDVKKSALAAAFYSWQSEQTRRIGVERGKYFIESIKGILTLRGRGDTDHNLPQNKNTWNDWKRLDPSKTVPLPQEVCLAIKSLTGIDVTPQNSLFDQYNSTELVTITSEPTARIVSNTENEDGEEQYEVSCSRVAFRRSRTLRVEAKWCLDDGKTLPRKYAVREVGSAIIGLRRAEVQLKADGPISPTVTLISPDKHDPFARAEGVRISDDPVNAGRWVVEGDAGEVLIGSLDLTNLAKAWHKAEDQMQLTVEGDRNDFEVDFRPIGEMPSGNALEEARSNMRKHFIANILRLRISEDQRAYVLSKAPIKT